MSARAPAFTPYFVPFLLLAVEPACAAASAAYFVCNGLTYLYLTKVVRFLSKGDLRVLSEANADEGKKSYEK